MSEAQRQLDAERTRREQVEMANYAKDGQIETLQAEQDRLREALQRISTEHCAYKDGDNSQYDIGVVDGHRCAARIARAALTPAAGGGK